MALSINSTVWRFGRDARPAVLRVTGETSRSWILNDGTKVPKSHPSNLFEVNPNFGCTQRYCLSQEAADEWFLLSSRWAMAERIKSSTNTAVLRAVAEALGMPTGVEEDR